MSQKGIEQRTRLQQPDNGLQDATGRGGVERGNGFKMKFGAREALIGGSTLLGLGLMTSSEALAQDNEQEGNFDIDNPIGEVTLESSIRFRVEPTTASAVVERDRSVGTYQVLDTVSGQRINGNTTWYRVHAPENTDTPIAYVAAGVVTSYEEYPEATIAPTETPTFTPTPEASREAEYGEAEVIGVVRVREENAVVISNPQIRVNARRNQTILYEPARLEELHVLDIIRNGVMYGGSETWYEVALPININGFGIDTPTPTATPTATPTPTPAQTLEGSYELRTIAGLGEVPIGYISGSQVLYRPNENNEVAQTQTPVVTESVITPTPTPMGTPVASSQAPIATSELTPTLPENQDLVGDGFVTLSELETFPQTIRYTFEGLSPDGVNPGSRTPVSVEIDIENLPALRGTEGQLVPFGFYVDETPPIDPNIFLEQLRVGNTELQLGYISGILTHVYVGNYGVVMLGVSVPIEATNQYANIHISMGQNPQRIAILDENGIQTRSISSERMPYGTDNPNYSGSREGSGIYFSSQRQVITYPTSSGLGELRVGQQILVRFTINDEELREQSVPLNGQFVGSGNRSALEVISDLTDQRTRNDGRVLWNNMGLVLPEASLILDLSQNRG